jgi:uncharacterized protein YbaP (TraB family)
MSYLYRLFSLLVLFCGFGVQAQEKSLLWEVSGNGLKTPSYVFGTIHLICKSDYLWTDAMKRCLANSNSVCFEMDLDDSQAMLGATNGLMDTTGKTLDSYFTEADYKRLKQFVKDSLGMDVGLFKQMKPIALQSLIGMRVVGCLDATSYEETIMNIAHKQGKAIYGLETPMEQISVLETIPTDTMVKELMEEIDHYNNNRGEYRKMITAYHNQDLQTLHNMITQYGEIGGGMDAFLDDRNVRWVPRMQPMMQKGSVFFAVGAGHLAGDKGVLALLRKAGYTVKPEQ